MKIVDLKAVDIDDGMRFQSSVLIRVDTDEGISGFGESHDGKDLVLKLKQYIIDQDPTDVERVMLRLRWRGGFKPWGSAVSGVEIALWDVAGKAAGVPVYKLLGGKTRDKVRLYCDCGSGIALEPGGSRYTPEAYAENARDKVKLPQGFKIFKFDIGLHGRQYLSVPGTFWEADAPPTRPLSIRGHATEVGLKAQVDCVKAVKEVLGEKYGLGVDCGPGQTIPAAIKLVKALEPLNLMWAEDLLQGDFTPYTDPEAYKIVTESSKTPTLTGEQIYLRHGFKPLIENRAVRIVSPDIRDCGGIAELKFIAELANLYGVLIAPHEFGLPITFMANVHSAAAMPRNFIAFEHHRSDDPWWEDFVKGVKKPLIKDGFATPPEKPGLGIELNEKTVRERLAEGEKYFE
jgi:L-alanine-DL-glutamate epimerase-like enolase superfamily enzyme